MSGNIYQNKHPLRSPMHGARGLGSAKDGTMHWWAQRVTAIALVPLLIWWVASVILMLGAAQADVQAWLAQPLVALPMLLVLAVAYYHAMLGCQVVIEDYIHGEFCKIMALLVMKASFWLVGIAAAFAIFKVAL